MYLFSSQKYIYSKAEKCRFNFRLNFITLTLSDTQKHSDEYVKKHLLVPFVEWLTKTCGAKMWLWKAECQDNGNIHFHITTHVFIHWKSVRKKWNKLLSMHGYCKYFQDGTNDKGNAATQIKAARNSKQVGGYLAGYIGKKDMYKKNETFVDSPEHFYKDVLNLKVCDCIDKMKYSLKRPVEGRLWSCSYNLTRIDTIASESHRCFVELRNEIDLSTEKFIKDDFFNIHLYSAKDLNKWNYYVKRFFEKEKDKLQLNEETQITIESFLN